MSFTEDELEQHCQNILGSRRIKNKITILCEGGVYDVKERLSPQTYKHMEKLPMLISIELVFQVIGVKTYPNF